MHQYNQINLLDDLVKIFPDFADYWAADTIDDEYPPTSLHGVYMSFLPFAMKTPMTEKQWKLLARHLSDSVAAGGDRENAVDTCFFEALRKDPFSRMLKPFLSKEAKSYIRT